jgi:hypothetical protein
VDQLAAAVTSSIAPLTASTAGLPDLLGCHILGTLLLSRRAVLLIFPPEDEYAAEEQREEEEDACSTRVL